MYIFVRFTGIIATIFGALWMLFGFGTAIYGFAQNAALVDLVNNYLLAGTNARLISDARLYAVSFGLLSFLGGMLSSALGQLLLVFADIANQTRETNRLLRLMQKLDE